MLHRPLQTLAIIVNYHSAPLALKAVGSVLDSETQDPLRVVVVDNSGDDEDLERLRSELPADVSLVASPKNIGFGPACNLAFERFPAEAILLLNPDGRLLPGGLAQLRETLFSREDIGAVSPRIFWDNGLRFQLPPSMPPALFEFDALLNSLGPRASFSRITGWFWRRHAVRIWETRAPIRVLNLSGGAVLLKSAAVKKAGGLFDPRFFLYFEDTDLFIRLRKAGFSLLMEPRAGAVHHYDQCGKNRLHEKRRQMERSRQLFLNKYHEPWKSGLKRLMKCFKERTPSANDMPTKQLLRNSMKSLPVPPQLQGKWLFELSPNQNFVPAAGCFGSGARAHFPEECRDLLLPGRYFFRIGGTTPFRPRLSPAMIFEKSI